MKKSLLLSVLAFLLVTFTWIFCSEPVSAKMNIPENAFEYNGHYYYYFAETVSWEDAETACENLGGHLVTFSNEDEEKAIWNYIEKKGTPAWIGVYNTGVIDVIFHTVEDSWKTVTKEKLTYKHWHSSQPDHEYHFIQNTYDMYAAIGRSDEVSTGHLDDPEQTPSWGDFDNIYCITSEAVKGYVCEWDIYEFEIENAPSSLKKGKKLTLSVKVYDAANHKFVKNATVKFKSSKKSVAKVSGKGKITAKKKGSCTITISYKGCSKKINLKVTN